MLHTQVPRFFYFSRLQRGVKIQKIIFVIQKQRYSKYKYVCSLFKLYSKYKYICWSSKLDTRVQQLPAALRLQSGIMYSENVIFDKIWFARKFIQTASRTLEKYESYTHTHIRTHAHAHAHTHTHTHTQWLQSGTVICKNKYSNTNSPKVSSLLNLLHASVKWLSSWLFFKNLIWAASCTPLRYPKPIWQNVLMVSCVVTLPSNYSSVAKWR